jgi:hypothetical protein
MKSFIRFGVCTVLCMTSYAAHGADIWTCTYPDFATKEPTTVEFPVVGDELLENDMFQLRFKILQNTAYGLVAVWSMADMEVNFPDKKTPLIGAMAMVIDKKTGELLRSVTAFDVPEKADTTVHGKCRHG